MTIDFVRPRGIDYALLFLLCCVNVYTIYAQQPTAVLRGIITTNDGSPVSGASVIVNNSRTNFNAGTSTDSLGSFVISGIPTGNGYTITLSAIGYESQTLSRFTIKERNTNPLAVKLNSSAVTLDQVVVVGYGTQKKSDVTGSVARVTTDKTEDIPNYNILQSLQGRVPGLNVTSPDRPGASPDISIRGINSISAGTSPLVVVDGIIYNGSLSDFNANDIATVDILKDASAAAVYGSRAANGVLLITTKMGATGKPQFNLNTYQGIQKPDRVIKVLDGPGYLQKVLDFRIANGLTADPTKIETYLTATEAENYRKGITTDWMDKVIKTGVMSNYHLDVSGKTDKTNYYIAGTYFKHEGIVKNDNYKRLTLNVNLTNKIADWYSVTVKSMFSNQDFSGREAA